jgi:hypothetical protein
MPPESERLRGQTVDWTLHLFQIVFIACNRIFNLIPLGENSAFLSHTEISTNARLSGIKASDEIETRGQKVAWSDCPRRRTMGDDSNAFDQRQLTIEDGDGHNATTAIANVAGPAGALAIAIALALARELLDLYDYPGI